jgi:hypothetical protein
MKQILAAKSQRAPEKFHSRPPRSWRLTTHETIIWEIGQYVVIGNTRLDLYWG